MKVYRTDEIRNVVLLGHGGCGKTSLVEAMAYVSGATSRMGKVDLAILRLAVYEMFFDEDVPVSVAINEAVELGKRFGTDDSSSFINGILGKLAKKADA